MRFVDINSALGKARRWASSTSLIQEDEVKDDAKLAEILRKLSSRIADIEAKTPPEPVEFEVNCGGAGETVSLTHNFNCPVRWSVVDWAKRSDYLLPTKQVEMMPSYIQTDFTLGGGGVWINAAGNFSVGQRIRLKKAREIVGVRFGWASNATSYSVKAKVYLQSTGALLASKTVTVQNWGVYEAIFDTPISADYTASDLLISIYETSGARYVYSNNTLWSTVAIELPEYQVVQHDVSVAGDAMPNISSGGGASHVMVEPMLGSVNACPHLVKQSTSTSARLDLKSYQAGKAVIRIEPSQYGLT